MSLVSQAATYDASTRRAGRVKQCMRCGSNFGMLTWRHTCLCCRRVTCDSCREFSSRDVPNHEGHKMKICNDCFYNELAICVVWHSLFSFKTRFYGDLQRATRHYNKIGKGCSRVMLRMRTGEVVESWFKNDNWRNRVMNCAILQRNSKIRSAATPPMGRSLTGSPHTPVPLQAPPSPTNTKPIVMVRLAVVTRGPEPEWTHYWCDAVPEDEISEIVGQATATLARMNVQSGAVVRDDGTCIFVSPQATLSDQERVKTEVERYVQHVPVLVMWNRNQNFEHRTITFDNLPAALATIESSVPAVAVDSTGVLLWHRNCTPAWKESLARAAGALLLQAIDVPFVAVAVSATDIDFYSDLYSAHRAVMDSQVAVMFAPGKGTARVLQAHPFVDRQAAVYWLLAPVVAAAEVHRTLNAQQQIEACNAPPAPNSAAELECPICMEPFDLETHRPCICGHCGNTACHGCLSRLEDCPSCRTPTEGRWPPNVAIVRLLSA